MPHWNRNKSKAAVKEVKKRTKHQWLKRQASCQESCRYQIESVNLVELVDSKVWSEARARAELYHKHELSLCFALTNVDQTCWLTAVWLNVKKTSCLITADNKEHVRHIHGTLLVKDIFITCQNKKVKQEQHYIIPDLIYCLWILPSYFALSARAIYKGQT